MTQPADIAAQCQSLDELVHSAQQCRVCPALAADRGHVVVGQHPPGARVFVVGEAPGAQEDLTGEPFVGRSGQLLDTVLHDAGLPRSSVAITSVVKCRPPANRTPTRAEIVSCSPWLDQQLQLIDPQIVVALGTVAMQWALGRQARVGEQRGRLQPFRDRQLMVTYHPSAALRFGPNGAPLAALRDDLAMVAAALR